MRRRAARCRASHLCRPRGVHFVLRASRHGQYRQSAGPDIHGPERSGDLSWRTLSAPPSLLIDHLARHAAVDHEIGAGDETGSLGVEQPADKFRDILWLANPAGRMLAVVLAAQTGIVLGLDPAGTDAIDPHVRREADRQCV